MQRTPSPPSAKSLLLPDILRPKSRGCIFYRVLDLFDVLRRLISSALFVGVFGGEAGYRKLKGIFPGVDCNLGLNALSLIDPLRLSVMSALTTSIYLVFVSSTSFIVNLTGVLSNYCVLSVSSTFSSCYSSDLKSSFRY